MKYIFFASLFLVSSTLLSCAGNDNTNEGKHTEQTEQQDSMRKSVLDEANAALEQGDTTVMPQDSAGTMKH